MKACIKCHEQALYPLKYVHKHYINTTHLFDGISMDLSNHTPTKNGPQYIITVNDQVTGYVVAVFILDKNILCHFCFYSHRSLCLWHIFYIAV